MLDRCCFLIRLVLAGWIITIGGIATAADADDGAIPRVIAFGDSLVAGFGLPQTDGFVPQLQSALNASNHKAVIVNAGVSGDTTSGGLSRLDWSVGPDADAVILELGGNDALRGIDPTQSRANLDQMLSRLGERGLPVLLIGMRAPANLGDAYAEPFNAMYAKLAAQHGVLLYPYFYEGTLGDPKYAQADGIHPSAEGIAVIVDRILPSVIQLIEQTSGG